MHPLLGPILFVLGAVCTSHASAQPRYDDSIDGQTKETSGGFREYKPAIPRDTRGQRVTTQQVVLLTSEADLVTRVKTEDLASYIQMAERAAYPELKKNKSSMAARVQFNCSPEKCEIQVASQGQAEETTLQALYDRLSKLPPLKASGGVVFQIIFSVGS